jgi:hypothetical protein
MRLEDQLSNFDLSKRLKELGVKQDGCFYWLCMGDDDSILCDIKRPKDETNLKNYYSAFTVAELGEMLPTTVLAPSGKTFQIGIALRAIWYVAPSGINFWHQNANTEADARAKMLIYLIENTLLNPPAR